MAPSDKSNKDQATNASGDADLAQAYRDLARGEQAATALESNLSNLESRLDAILAALEAKEDSQSSTPAKIDGSSQVKSSAGLSAKPQEGSNGDAAEDKEDAA
ncbi:hypothetical protein F66182_233 [Fusarium sp. NRRL 66182]|nr:hypothetical protein F66182_233 [Fusarium sp. NRRL 66182]